jgi:hypothetical protein
MRLCISRLRSGLMAALILAVAPAFTAAYAQSLFKIRIGDDAASSSLLARTPTAKDSYKGYTVRKWTLDNGNDLAVTTTAFGMVVYLESDWNGKSDETGCDLDGFTFGQTTLSDIQERFGSNGFQFKQRNGVINVPDGIVMMNSYEFDSRVVTFFTRVLERDYSKAKKTGTKWVAADHARLDAISIASSGYAEQEWGERIYDPGYKPVSWK